MSTDVEKAKAVLLEFMSAMNQWENKFAKLFQQEHGGSETHGDQAKIELQPIYDRYVAGTSQGRLSAGYPPEFDPNAENIVTNEPQGTNKVTIETLWTHPKIAKYTRRNRYTMLNKNGEWRLGKKESYDRIRCKWVSIPI